MYQPPKPSEKFQHLTDAELDANLQAGRRAVDAMRLQFKQLQDDLMRNIAGVDELGEEQVCRELAAVAAGAKPSWERMLELPPFTSMTKYKSTQAMLNAGFPEAPCDLIWLNGGTTKVNQHLLEIALVRGAPHLTAAVTDRLREVLPAMRLQSRVPLEDDERPYKRISVLEKSLSQRAFYYLAINEEAGMYQVRAGSSGQVKVVENCDSLDSLLQRVEEKYYYRQVVAQLA